MGLDRFQQAAVDCDAPHIQIIGHPGTGKTLVMGNRIARLVREGTPPESIVALTFSNSARNSLKERLVALMGDNDITHAVEVNTFHSFCANLVSSFPDVVGLTGDWRMVDHLDMYNLLADPTLELPLKNRTRFPDGFLPEDRMRFRERLAQDKSYDFDTAMELGCQIAQERDLNIQHLLIDEFQDGQFMQWELVKCIHQMNPALNVCVVGDANQEIFNFRQDHLRDAFAVMRSTFPGTAVLNLRYNYRSSPEIIENFQKIAPPESSHRPDLIATRPHNAEPELVIYASAVSEAIGISDIVKLLARDYKPSEIAVLVRYNRHILPLKETLKVSGIPTANAVNFRALAALALPNLFISLLKWSNDPRDLYLAQLLYSKHYKFLSDYDYKALYRNSPRMLDALSQSSKYSNHPFLVTVLPQIRESLLNCYTVPELVTKTITFVENWRQMAEGRKRKVHESAAWSEFKRMVTSIELSPEQLAAGTHDENDRLSSLQQGSVLKSFLKHLFQNLDVVGEGSVQIRTIHSAKSREWPCVIVAGRAQDTFRFFDTNEADERRLLYVAASRARERLFFTSASPVGGSGFLRFLTPGSARPMLQHRDAATLYPNQYLRILARSSLSRRLML